MKLARSTKAQSLLKLHPDELMDVHDVSPIVDAAKYDGRNATVLFRMKI
jgi:hypothetical protein